MSSVPSGINQLAAEVRGAALALREQVRQSNDALRTAQSGQFNLLLYPEAAERLAPVVAALVEFNPDMLSPEDVGRTVLYELVVPVITGSFFARFDKDGNFSDDVVEAELLPRIADELTEMVRVDWGAHWKETLCVGLFTTEAFDFAGCRFIPIGEDELADKAGWLPERVRFEARTRVGLLCRGDDHRNTAYLQERLTAVLLTLAGACWPEMVNAKVWPLSFEFARDIPAMVGAGYDPSLLVYRTSENFPFDSVLLKNQGMSGRLRLPEVPVRLWGEHLELLSVASEDPVSARPIVRRVVACLYWLGEALRPDSDSARVVRVVTAIEALLGKDAVDQNGNRSQVKRLLPLLLGATGKEARAVIHAAVDEAFGGRNEALHRGALVRAPRVESFGGMVWRAARAILELPESVADEADLNHWANSPKAPVAANLRTRSNSTATGSTE